MLNWDKLCMRYYINYISDNRKARALTYIFTIVAIASLEQKINETQTRMNISNR